MGPMTPRKAFLLGGAMDVNRATTRELRLLRGIGPKKARRIVTHRFLWGPFKEKNDLLRVKGIHPSWLRRMDDSIKVGTKSTVSCSFSVSVEK